MSINVPVLPQRNEASWLGPRVAAVFGAIVLFSLAFAALEARVGAVPLDSGGDHVTGFWRVSLGSSRPLSSEAFFPVGRCWGR